MTGSNDNNTATGHNGSERRTRPHLREIFDQAYRVAYPLLDAPGSSHSDSPTHFLRVVLHDAFPDLHLQDVAILSVSIERVYRERSKTEAQ
jgi:hypothetical protein